mgnify:CR=1 FL=1
MFIESCCESAAIRVAQNDEIGRESTLQDKALKASALLAPTFVSFKKK